MHYATVFKIIGTMLVLFSISMLPPAGVALYFQDSTPYPYLLSFVLAIGLGIGITYSQRNATQDLRVRDGFLVVILFWVVLSAVAAIPMMLADNPHESFTDAIFDTVSGFTTTGVTVVSGIDALPHAMKYYRQQLQFMGGMGIIVLAVAILPMLGVGGMQLYRAETPRAMNDNKLTPRITQTAKALWFIYVGLTVICAGAYYWGGMRLFDAIGESFATISTGGFSLHDNSFAHYNSLSLQIIACVFMLLGGTNFSLHFLAFSQRSLKSYWQDEEFRVFILILFLFISITSVILMAHVTYAQPQLAISQAVFNVISFVTTTGFTTASIEQWPRMLPILLLLLGIVGGCAASTSGGVKIVRGLILLKHSRNEVRKLIHPHGVLTIKYGQHALPSETLHALWGFIASFIALFLLILLLLTAIGLDLLTAFSATVATLANTGVGLGELSQNFAHLPTIAKWLLIVSMLAGRLEIFTLLVIFSPAFWRK